MQINLEGTLRHKGNPNIPEHHATFGIYNEITARGLNTYVTIGVKEGENVASVDVKLEELEKMVEALYAASRSGGI